MRSWKAGYLLAVFLAAAAPRALAAEPGSAELEARVAALEQELKVLRRLLEVKKEDEDKKKAETPVITTAAKDGFSIASADGSRKLKLRGYAQADGRFFTDGDETAPVGTVDTFTMRRVRPVVEGLVGDDLGFAIEGEFAGGNATLMSAYLDYRYAQEFRLRAGKFKVLHGLERVQSASHIRFVERGFPSSLGPDHDVGVQAAGDLGPTLAYSLSVTNGVADGASSDTDMNNEKDVAARLFVHPFAEREGFWKGFGAGAGATYGHHDGTGTLPTLRTLGRATMFTYDAGVVSDGAHARWTPQFYHYAGPFGLMGELAFSSQEVTRPGFAAADIGNEAYLLAASVVLTGEDAGFKGVSPRNPFDPRRGRWGAWELAARVTGLDVDDEAFRGGWATASRSVSEAHAYGVALTGYLNANVKWMLDFEHTDFEGGAAGFTDRPDENAIFTRFQFVY